MTAAIKPWALCLLITLWAVPLPCSDPAQARDLGVLGATWTITEDDLLDYMQAKAALWEENGGLARYQKHAKQRARRYVAAPPAVLGFTKAGKTQSRLFDPSLTLNQDLRDHKGNVFARAGTRINPLDTLSMSHDLLFIDGSDEEQVRWALAQSRITQKRTKIILVAGPVMDLQKTHKRRLYFDQKGLLSDRFSLTRVPSRIIQKGRQLEITEINIDEGGTDTSITDTGGGER